MIIGMPSLVIGGLALIAFPFVWWRALTADNDDRAFRMLGLTIALILAAVLGAGFGMTTLICGPPAIFGSDACYGGVPWP